LARIRTLRNAGHAAVKEDPAYADPSVLNHEYVLDLEGCPEPSNLKELSSPYADIGEPLEQIKREICKYVDLDPLAAVVVTLWIVFTHIVGRFIILPLLIIRADDEHHDNMSMLFALLLRLSLAVEKVSAMSRQYLMQDKNRTAIITLLFDDPTIIKNRDIYNLLINSYRADEAYIRTEDNDNTRKHLFGARALASYGGLPYAIRCRGIVLDLTQRNNSHRAARLTSGGTKRLIKLREDIYRSSQSVAAVVRDAKPEMPNWLSNSEQDNWEPLFKIAMVAGGDWLEKVTQAAALLSTVQDQDGKVNGLLLADMHEVVNARKSDRIRTLTLINRLCEKNAELWGRYNRGAEITPSQIADLMRPFGLKSKVLRFEGLEQPVKHGYLKSKIVNAYHHHMEAAKKAQA
jgi:putative DNA primase/helicase